MSKKINVNCDKEKYVDLSLIVKREYNNRAFDFYEDENSNIYVRRDHVGRALDYATDSCISVLHRRNKHKLDEFLYTSYINRRRGRVFKTKMYRIEAIHRIVSYSRQPEKDTFYDWFKSEINSIESVCTLVKGNNVVELIEKGTSIADRDSSNIQTFNSEYFGNLRVFTINGEPYFVGRDVANALGYKRGTKAVQDHVFEEDIGEVLIQDSIGRMQSTPTINESGLYALIFSSELESAKTFKRWVTSEVLPTIRKTGGYVSDDKLFVDTYLPFADDSTKILFNITLETIREQNDAIRVRNEVIQEKSAEIAELRPKASHWSTYMDTEECLTMSNVAKALNIKGLGRNKLFALLRSKNILNSNNEPYQTQVDAGRFKVIVGERNNVAYTQTVVTPEGMEFISDQLAKWGYV